MNKLWKLLRDQGLILGVACGQVGHLAKDCVDAGPGDDSLGSAPDDGGRVESHVSGEELILVGGVNILEIIKSYWN